MNLVVVRTVKICSPFSDINTTLLKAISAAYLTVLVALASIDIWYDYDLGENRFPWHTLWLNINMTFVGHNLPSAIIYKWNFLDLTDWAKIEIGISAVIFLVPVTLVLLCLLTQLVVTWRRSVSRSSEEEDQPALTDWSHVNLTVILLSLLFITCNSGIAAFTLYFKIPNVAYIWEDSFTLPICEILISTTLPLLSALFSPIILISRSNDLRAGIVSTARQIVGLGTETGHD